MIGWILAIAIQTQGEDIHWNVAKALLEKASASGVPLGEGSLLVSKSDPWFALTQLDKKVHGYGSLNPKAVYYYGLYDSKRRKVGLTRGEVVFKKDANAPQYGKVLVRVLGEERMRNWLKKGFDFSVMNYDAKRGMKYVAFIGNLDRTVESTMVIYISGDLKQVQFVDH